LELLLGGGLVCRAGALAASLHALVAVGRPLAESGCGLRSCAARRTVIACPFLTTRKQSLWTISRATGQAGFLRYFGFMSDGQSALENSKFVSFSDAARFLGVDVFTFYSMVQREEIPSFPGLWGEFVVSQDDLDKLIAGKNALC
jgi:hypothetical protein